MTSTIPGVTVRLAQLPEDMPAIVAVRRRVFVEEQGVATAVAFDVNDRLASHVVGLVDGRIVGIGRLQITGQEAQIAWVAVVHEHRRHGVGRAIVRRLIELADAAGVELTLLNAQTHALRFYEHFGFRPVGSVFTMGGIEHQLMSRRRP
jgi:ElaA protein